MAIKKFLVGPWKARDKSPDGASLDDWLRERIARLQLRRRSF